MPAPAASPVTDAGSVAGSVTAGAVVDVEGVAGEVVVARFGCEPVAAGVVESSRLNTTAPSEAPPIAITSAAPETIRRLKERILPFGR